MRKQTLKKICLAIKANAQETSFPVFKTFRAKQGGESLAGEALGWRMDGERLKGFP